MRLKLKSCPFRKIKYTDARESERIVDKVRDQVESKAAQALPEDKKTE